MRPKENHPRKTWMIPFDFSAASRFRFRREDSRFEIVAVSAGVGSSGRA